VTRFSGIQGGTRLATLPRHVIRVTVRGGFAFRSPYAALQRAVDAGLWPGVVLVAGNPVGTPDAAVAVQDVVTLPSSGPVTARDLAVRVASVTGFDVIEVADTGPAGSATESSRQLAFDGAERAAAEDSLGARLARVGLGAQSSLRWAVVGSGIFLALWAMSRSSGKSWE
jgi:hypothetical protein